ncbi:cytochrome c biogenesis protein CcsA [Terriglobus albidus]|uniref:cytochrome c biogenesis protein CcsA n=1 Tax=Terriglobus albidus TaxID=1592106 RepID=UPI001FE26BA9|nr:cytochrome c biogenesis protein CcsA [Terriglobus albidus]
MSSVLLIAGFYEAVFVAPVEATMGSIYRIFYWHVPINVAAEIFPYVNMLASIALLLMKDKKPDFAGKLDALALATAEVTVLYSFLGLATGMLWGRPVWGIWWAWDARMTSFLALFLLYVSYLILRHFSSSEQVTLVAAVLSIFAGIDVPIVFMSIRWWRTQHPSPVLSGDGSLDRSMWPAILINLAAWFLWGCTLVYARYVIVRHEQRAVECEAMEGITV